VEISSLSFPFLWCALSTLPPLLHVSFQFFAYYSVLGFLGGQGSVCPGGYSGLSQEWLWEYHLSLICSPVGLLDVSQAGLELASGTAEALLFS
jgi:hypothetical protein